MLSANHLVAACNTLCGVVDQCLASSSQRAKVVYSQSTCLQFLDVFIEQHAEAKSRIMKQVLMTLARLFGKLADDSRHDFVRSEMIERLIVIVLDGSKASKAKPAMQALATFSLKGVLSPVKLIEKYASMYHGRTLNSAVLSSFLRRILAWTCVTDMGATVAQMTSTILSSNRESSLSTMFSEECQACQLPIPVWMSPLLATIESNPESLQTMKTYVFSVLFSSDIELFWNFLRHLDVEKHLQLTHSDLQCKQKEVHSEQLTTLILFSAMSTGKDLGLIQETSE